MFHISDNVRTVFTKRTRLGRGPGSGTGKNSGKGHKGQVKRSGKPAVTFEGGKKSLVRRSPKLPGFKARPRKDLAILTLSAIDREYSEGQEVTLVTLLEKKLINDKVKKVRIIKTGELSKKVTFADEESIHLTKGVKEAIGI